MKKEYIIPIFVPHLGCKNDCTFCNQKSISGQIKDVTEKDVTETIESFLKNFPEGKKYVEVAFFGGSFTGIDKDKQLALLNAVKPYIKAKKVNSIRCSTRPDYINKDILKMLKKNHVKTIELGVQSSNDYVLRASKRGHTFEDVKKASKLIRRYRFRLGHQMMVGLPESDRKDELETAKDLAKLKPKMIRIYPVLVIKKTQLEKDYKNGEYEPLELNQAVEICGELCEFFNKKRINVIRVGLQSTDTISDPKKNLSSEVVAGPYHESFRQLVETEMFYDMIKRELRHIGMKVEKVELLVNPEDVNMAVGYKRQNVQRLEENYGVRVSVKQSKRIKKNKIKLKVIEKHKDFLDS